MLLVNLFSLFYYIIICVCLSTDVANSFTYYNLMDVYNTQFHFLFCLFSFSLSLTLLVKFSNETLFVLE